jgi:hypothetical protein
LSAMYWALELSRRAKSSTSRNPNKMNTPIKILIGIGTLAGTFLIGWKLAQKKTQPRIVFSIANFAQVAYLQGDATISTSDVMMMRRADGTLGTTGYKIQVYSLPGCCPCPSDPSVLTCTCDFAEFYGQYAALETWNAELSIQNQADSTSKALTESSHEGGLITYKFPELKPGPHLFIIKAAFNEKDPRTYKVRVDVDQSGRLRWTDKP